MNSDFELDTTMLPQKRAAVPDVGVVTPIALTAVDLFVTAIGATLFITLQDRHGGLAIESFHRVFQATLHRDEPE
jgi:maltodextrin utilization protein YvdJ